MGILQNEKKGIVQKQSEIGIVGEAGDLKQMKPRKLISVDDK